MTCPPCVALPGMAHSILELHNAVIHMIILVNFLWRYSLCVRPAGNLFQEDVGQNSVPHMNASASAADLVAGHCQPMPLSETPKHSYASLSLSVMGVTPPFSWVLVCTRFCLCPPIVSASLILWKFCNLVLLIFKIWFPGDSQSLC